MGLSNSKDSGMRRVSSSSAAFGRLRIDSPRATTPGGGGGGGGGSMSMRRRQQLRMNAENHYHGAAAAAAAGGSSPMIGSGFNTEQSPLIGQHRQLSSSSSSSSPKHHHHPSDASDLMVLESLKSPPLAVWILPALCCAMAYALYNIFIKKGSSHIHPVLGGVILQLVAALLGCCLLGFLVWSNGNDGSVLQDFDIQGIHWAILAGLAVGTAEIISFFVSSLGVQAMQSIPIIIGGSVMFGTVLGAVALHEELSYRGWLGVVLISVGISLVGLDSEGEE